MPHWTRGIRLCILLGAWPIWTFILTGRTLTGSTPAEGAIVVLVTLTIVAISFTGLSVVNDREARRN